MEKVIKLTAIIVGLFIVNAVTAQEDFRERFSFGLKAGINVNNVYDSQNENFNADARVGFAGGAFFSLPLGKVFALQPEVMFSQKGIKASGTTLGIPYSLKRNVNYIDIPLLFAIRPANFISIVLGPQVNFKLNQQDKVSIGNTSSENSQDFENNIRTFMLGAQVGLDINIRHFVFSPRLALDLLNSNKDGSTNDPRYKNITAQFTLGYRF